MKPARFPVLPYGRLAVVLGIALIAIEASAQNRGGYRGLKVMDIEPPPAKIPGVRAQLPPVQTFADKVDALIAAKLEAEKQQPNALAGDEIFVRRVYLDVIGRVPTQAEALAFVESQAPGKRAKLIDQLLASEGYVQNMFNFWADVLRVKNNIAPGGQGNSTGGAYIQWLKDSLRENKPYDQMVRELLTADGASYENGAIGYYMRDYNMELDNMAITTQVFLGTQMVCAQCHDHPFDKWTQMDYYKMAGHTYGMRGNAVLTNQEPVLAELRKEGYKRAEQREMQQAMGQIRFRLRFNHITAFERKLELPHDYQYDDAKPGQVVDPVIPASFTSEGSIIKEGQAPMEAYAQWMTSRDNPRFTLVVANRLWKKLFGMGVIDPVDELTDSTVPSNPALMTFLEQTMKAVNYDMKAYMKVLLNSKAYQREAYTKDVEPGEMFYFSGPLLRRMSAEQIWDSMVALLRDDPDESSARTHMETRQSLTRIEWMDRVLAIQSPKEMVEGMREIADYQKDLAAQVRKNLEIIKTSKDEAEIRKARQSSRRQRAMIYERVDEKVFERGFQKMAEIVRTQGVDRLAEITDDEFARQVAFAVNRFGKDVTMEKALAFVSLQMNRSVQTLEKTRREREIKEWGIGERRRDQRGYEQFADYRDKSVLRAADLRNPAPNGHFLRLYGQSDRELVDNSNREGSVMQALTMMNGTLFRSLINPYSKLSRDMAEAKDADAMIDTIYMNTLTRKATADEKALLRPLIAENTDKGRGDVLWSVLNTRQFLFIQ